MLQLDGQPWSTGSTDLLLGRDIDHQGTTLVDCTIAGVTTKAFLDTGAELSIIGASLASFLEQALMDDLDRPRTLSTRFGNYRGNTYRLPTTLLATAGRSLTFETTYLVCPDWNGPVVLGFYDALDRIRLAFDPGSLEAPPILYFGEL